MCGVWTRIGLNRPIESKEILFPVKMLAHRGPDSYGWFSDSKVALVHTRLSIIDLNGGAQPLESFDRKYLGIVNGELYDYQGHRENLQRRGVAFRTHSDSEVLLNLFAEGGGGALRSLSGEWAFIFYDRERSLVHFARDLHGVKPLFYRWDKDSLTISSETKALSEATPVLSEDYIKTFLGRSLMPQATALDECFHVLPGRLYTFDISQKQLTSKVIDYLPLSQKRYLKGQEAVEATEEALRASVKRRLVADVEVGCYLSGGVDSALTTAMAVELGAKPKAFTVGFADRDLDERQIAGRIAQHLGIEHHVCQMTSKNFIPSLIQSIVAFENPVTNPHGAAKNLLSHLASQHVKVVLSGEGADEWFGGYAYLRIQKIQRFAARHPLLGQRLLKQFMEEEKGRSMNHLDGRSLMNRDLFAKYFFGHQPAVLGRVARHRAYHYLTGDRLGPHLERMCQKIVDMMKEDWPGYGDQGSLWDINTWFGARVDLLHYILANVGDRQEMSHSLEGRTPFLDPQVIQVAASIEENTLLRALSEKDVLKKVARRIYPKEIAERPKHPFFAPIKYFYLRENKDLIQSYIDVARGQTPWLNWNNLDRLLTRPRPLSSSLEPLKNSTRILLFSLGVLVQHLREEPTLLPRGFRLPQTVQDLEPYRYQRS